MSIIPKKVSNYELFYDLMFVLAVSMIVGLLHHMDAFHFGEYIQLVIAMIIVFKIWIAETMYLNKYGERDLLDICTIYLNMFLVGYIAQRITSNRQDTYLEFSLLYVLAMCSILLQYYLRTRRLGKFDPSMKMNITYILTDLIVFGLWLFLQFTGLYSQERLSEMRHFLIALVGTSASLIVPVFFSLKNKGVPSRVNFPHLVERLQLLTIIFLGSLFWQQ